jgi:hypothetical protein
MLEDSAHLASQIPAVRRDSVLVCERECDAVRSPAMNGCVLLGGALGIRFITSPIDERRCGEGTADQNQQKRRARRDRAGKEERRRGEQSRGERDEGMRQISRSLIYCFDTCVRTYLE